MRCSYFLVKFTVGCNRNLSKVHYTGNEKYSSLSVVDGYVHIRRPFMSCNWARLFMSRGRYELAGLRPLFSGPALARNSSICCCSITGYTCLRKSSSLLPKTITSKPLLATRGLIKRCGISTSFEANYTSHFMHIINEQTIFSKTKNARAGSPLITQDLRLTDGK